MVNIGPYKQDFEVHRSSFEKPECSDPEALAVPGVVARPLPEISLSHPARCFESLPGSNDCAPTVTSTKARPLKVRSAVATDANLLSDATDPGAFGCAYVALAVLIYCSNNCPGSE